MLSNEKEGENRKEEEVPDDVGHLPPDIGGGRPSNSYFEPFTTGTNNSSLGAPKPAIKVQQMQDGQQVDPAVGAANGSSGNQIPQPQVEGST